MPNWRSILSDIGVVVGIALIATGLWWVYPPLALVFTGVAVTYAAVRGA